MHTWRWRASPTSCAAQPHRVDVMRLHEDGKRCQAGFVSSRRCKLVHSLEATFLQCLHQMTQQSKHAQAATAG